MATNSENVAANTDLDSTLGGKTRRPGLERRPALVFLRGELLAVPIPLERSEVTIGRALEADVRVNDTRASRLDARITTEYDGDTGEKRFRLSERANVQFRSEAYNILNRVNFGTPNGAVFLNGNIQRDGTRGTVNPQAGQIITTRGNPRQLQFGLRIEF